jgi:hypothetical protein
MHTYNWDLERKYTRKLDNTKKVIHKNLIKKLLFQVLNKINLGSKLLFSIMKCNYNSEGQLVLPNVSNHRLGRKLSNENS